MPADRETAEEKCREVPHFLLHKFTNVNILLHLFYLSLCSCIVYLSFWMFKIKLQVIYVFMYVYIYMHVYTHIFPKTCAYKNKLNEHRQEVNIDVKFHWILLSLVPVRKKGTFLAQDPAETLVWHEAWVTLSLQRALTNNSSLLFVCLFLNTLFLIMCICVGVWMWVPCLLTSEESQIPWSRSYRWLPTALYGCWVLN